MIKFLGIKRCLEEVGMQDLIERKKDFITYLKVEKNLSDHTIRAYESDLKQFF